METHRCPFCEHDNLANAKYCSNCGGCLYLVPCPSCGAISDIKAGTCYQCHQPMQGGAGAGMGVDAAPVAVIAQTRAPDLMSRALETGKLEIVHPAPLAGEATVAPAPRRNSLIAGAVAAMVAVAGLGYYAYQHHGIFAVPAPTSAGGAAPTSSSAAVGAVIGQNAAASAAAGSAASASAAACSSEVSTLGICAPQSDAKKETETAPAASVLGAGSAAASPPAQGCAAAAAALGLCTPTADATTTVPTVTHTRRSE